MSKCPFIPSQSPCYVQLGKYGDIMILLVGLHQIFKETNQKPVILTSQEYGNILEGVTYVRPWIEAVHWIQDLGRARRMAELKFGWAITPKWWDDPTHVAPPVNGVATTTLHFMGRNIVLPEKEWDSYQLSQWRAAGFKDNEMTEWPLVFDNRNRKRELELASRVFKGNRKKLLINLFGGGSSRFGFDSEVWNVVRIFQNQFEVVDLARIVAPRIYDLLGLFERSVGMVTIDTSTLHLAGACNMPYVAYIANGGGGSIPKGNCQLSIRYSDTISKLEALKQQLTLWAK